MQWLQWFIRLFKGEYDRLRLTLKGPDPFVPDTFIEFLINNPNTLGIKRQSSEGTAITFRQINIWHGFTFTVKPTGEDGRGTEITIDLPTIAQRKNALVPLGAQYYAYLRRMQYPESKWPNLDVSKVIKPEA